MSNWSIINADCFDVLAEVVKKVDNPVIVTDPPFNIGYHYDGYKDKLPESEYWAMLGRIANIGAPSVFVHYPEGINRLSIEIGRAPERVLAWVYPSNTARQHRDIAFYGIKPDFRRVRQPYRNQNDKRVRELQKRTGGVGSMTGSNATRSRTYRRKRPPIPARCRSTLCRKWWESCLMQ